LPALSAAQSPSERRRRMGGMWMAATLVTAPATVALVVLRPLVVSIFYSHAFVCSPGFLRWTLAGDYLKVSAWVLAAPMLAMRDTRAFLAIDLVTQATFFAAAMLLARAVEAAEGAAIGFLASYAVYFGICYAYARRRYGFHMSRAGLAAWFTGLALIIGASVSAWNDSTVHFIRAAIWIGLALGSSAGFAMYIRGRE
jgi:O-antigen/teichoic acid export membrane protein